MVKRKREQVKWIEDHLAAASLAYKKENDSDMNEKVKLSPGWEIYKIIKGPHGTQMKIWVSPTNGNVLVAFRGTSSLSELKLDINMGSDVFLNKDGDKVGYIYRGFNTAWKDFKEKLETHLRVLKETGFLKDGGNLEFTGHSLGGAVAEIAATYFSDVYTTLKVTETSVAAPSSGDRHFGDYSRSRPNLDRIRIVSKGDPIANTKLPGMDFVEKENVIELQRSKKNKNAVMDALKAIGSVVFPVGTLVASGVEESYQNHLLENYATMLIKDYQDRSQLSVPSPPEEIAPSETTVPVSDGSCLCECHIYDQAVDQRKVPPTSLATIPATEKPQNTATLANVTTSDPMVPREVDAMQQPVVQKPSHEEIFAMQDDEQEVAEAEPSEFEQMIREILDTSAQKDQEKLDKFQEKANTLQEQYAYLTNKADESLDPVSLDRQRYEKTQEDLTYFDSRIQMEIAHPQYVPNDRDGGTVSRDKAVQLKNRLNKVYAMIQSVRSKQFTTALDPTYKPPDDATIQKELATDQTTQAQETLKDNQLDPDQQPGSLIFDIDLLGDLDGTDQDPKALQQLGKWLEYSGMTTRDLYDNLATIMTSKYKNDRLEELRTGEQELRQTAANDIKLKISELQKEGGNSEAVLEKQKQRETFVTQVTSNPEVQRLIQSRKVDLQKISDSFTTDSNSSKMITELLGYDAENWAASLEQSYLKQLDTMARGTNAQEFGEAMYQMQQKLERNKKYPWVTMEQFRNLPQDDPEALDKAAIALRPTVPSQWHPQPIENLAVDKELLQRKVEELPNAKGQIKDIQFKDFFLEERKKLEDQYNDPDKLKELFKSWNPGQGDTGDMISMGIDAIFGFGLTTKSTRAWERIANGGTPSEGWFDKSGNFLGSSASPDFAEYVKAHPELGVKYVAPERSDFNKFFDTIEDFAGTAVGMRYGVNPFELRDKATGALGGGSNYDPSTGTIRNPYDEQDEEPVDDGGFGGLDPMAMMFMMNQQGGAPQGETPPKPGSGYKRTPLKTRPQRSMRSRTSKISFRK